MISPGTILRKTIDSLLEDYFCDVARNNFSYSLLAGKIEMKDLVFKENFLLKFNLPYTVKFGSLGAIEVNWSIYDLKLNLVLKNMIIVLDCNYEEPKSIIEELRFIHRVRIEKLIQESLESLNNGKHDTINENLSFMEQLYYQIIKNTTINIENIHIRLENSNLPATSKICFGIIVKQLNMNSIDSSTVDSDRKFEKILRLEHASLYYDNELMVGKCNDPGDNSRLRVEMIDAVDNIDRVSHTILMHDFNSNMSIKICQHQNFRELNIPKLYIVIVFEKIILEFDPNIVRCMLFLIKRSQDRMYDDYLVKDLPLNIVENPLDKSGLLSICFASRLRKNANNCLYMKQSLLKRIHLVSQMRDVMTEKTTNSNMTQDRLKIYHDCLLNLPPVMLVRIQTLINSLLRSNSWFSSFKGYLFSSQSPESEVNKAIVANISELGTTVPNETRTEENNSNKQRNKKFYEYNLEVSFKGLMITLKDCKTADRSIDAKFDLQETNIGLKYDNLDDKIKFNLILSDILVSKIDGQQESFILESVNIEEKLCKLSYSVSKSESLTSYNVKLLLNKMNIIYDIEFFSLMHNLDTNDDISSRAKKRFKDISDRTASDFMNNNYLPEDLSKKIDKIRCKVRCTIHLPNITIFLNDMSDFIHLTADRISLNSHHYEEAQGLQMAKDDLYETLVLKLIGLNVMHSSQIFNLRILDSLDIHLNFSILKILSSSENSNLKIDCIIPNLNLNATIESIISILKEHNDYYIVQPGQIKKNIKLAPRPTKFTYDVNLSFTSVILNLRSANKLTNLMKTEVEDLSLCYSNKSTNTGPESIFNFKRFTITENFEKDLTRNSMELLLLIANESEIQLNHVLASDFKSFALSNTYFALNLESIEAALKLMKHYSNKLRGDRQFEEKLQQLRELKDENESQLRNFKLKLELNQAKIALLENHNVVYLLKVEGLILDCSHNKFAAIADFFSLKTTLSDSQIISNRLASKTEEENIRKQYRFAIEFKKSDNIDEYSVSSTWKLLKINVSESIVNNLKKNIKKLSKIFVPLLSDGNSNENNEKNPNTPVISYNINGGINVAFLSSDVSQHILLSINCNELEITNPSSPLNFSISSPQIIMSQHMKNTSDKVLQISNLSNIISLDESKLTIDMDVKRAKLNLDPSVFNILKARLLNFVDSLLTLLPESKPDDRALDLTIQFRTKNLLLNIFVEKANYIVESRLDTLICKENNLISIESIKMSHSSLSLDTGENVDNNSKSISNIKSIKISRNNRNSQISSYKLSLSKPHVTIDSKIISYIRRLMTSLQTMNNSADVDEGQDASASLYNYEIDKFPLELTLIHEVYPFSLLISANIALYLKAESEMQSWSINMRSFGVTSNYKESGYNQSIIDNYNMDIKLVTSIAENCNSILEIKTSTLHADVDLTYLKMLNDFYNLSHVNIEEVLNVNSGNSTVIQKRSESQSPSLYISHKFDEKMNILSHGQPINDQFKFLKSFRLKLAIGNTSIKIIHHNESLFRIRTRSISFDHALLNNTKYIKISFQILHYNKALNRWMYIIEPAYKSDLSNVTRPLELILHPCVEQFATREKILGENIDFNKLMLSLSTGDPIVFDLTHELLSDLKNILFQPITISRVKYDSCISTLKPNSRHQTFFFNNLGTELSIKIHSVNNAIIKVFTLRPSENFSCDIGSIKDYSSDSEFMEIELIIPSIDYHQTLRIDCSYVFFPIISERKCVAYIKIKQILGRYAIFFKTNTSIVNKTRFGMKISNSLTTIDLPPMSDNAFGKVTLPLFNRKISPEKFMLQVFVGQNNECVELNLNIYTESREIVFYYKNHRISICLTCRSKSKLDMVNYRITLQPLITIFNELPTAIQFARIDTDFMPQLCVLNPSESCDLHVTNLNQTLDIETHLLNSIRYNFLLELTSDYPTIEAHGVDKKSSRIALGCEVSRNKKKPHLKYHIFIDFLIINHTNLELDILYGRRESTLIPKFTDEPIVKHIGTAVHKKPKEQIKVKIATSSQNELEKISHDATGTIQNLLLRSENYTYNLIAKLTKLTTNVTLLKFIPAYSLVNMTSYPIYLCCGKSAKSKHFATVEPMSTYSILWFPNNVENNKLFIKIFDHKSKATSVKINKSSYKFIPVSALLDRENRSGFFVIETGTTDIGSYEITVRAATNIDCNATIINLDSEPFLKLILPVSRSHSMESELKPGKEIDFYAKISKKNPVLSWKLVIDNVTKEFEFDINLMNSYIVKDLKFANKTINCILTLDGKIFKAVLSRDSNNISAIAYHITQRFYNFAFSFNCQKIGISLIDEVRKRELLHFSLAGVPYQWGYLKNEKREFVTFPPNFNHMIEQHFREFENAPLATRHTHSQFEINIASNSKKPKVLNIDFSTMKVSEIHDLKRHCKSPAFTFEFLSDDQSRIAISLDVHTPQLDFFGEKMDYIIFSRTPLPPSLNNSLKNLNFLSLRLFVDNLAQSNDYWILNVLSVAIQEFDLIINSEMISEFTYYFSSIVFSGGFERFLDLSIDNISHNKLRLHCVRDSQNNIHNRLSSDNSLRLYARKIYLGPIKFNIKFQRNVGNVTSDSILNSLPFNIFLDSQDVTFTLNYVNICDQFVDISTFNSILYTTYRNSILMQFYKLVLGMNIISTPYTLVTNFADGVQSLFYEPYQGAIMDSQHFFEGIQLGSAVFISKVVGGFSLSIAKLTKDIGSNISLLTFDQKFINKRSARSQSFVQKESTDIIQSTFANFFTDIAESIGGVVTKPIDGAKKDGVSGFFVNLGKGVAGLITKPIIATTDLLSGTFTAFSQGSDLTDRVEVMRPARIFYDDASNLIPPINYLQYCGIGYLKDIISRGLIVTKNKHETADLIMAIPTWNGNALLFHKSFVILYSVESKDLKLFLRSSEILKPIKYDQDNTILEICAGKYSQHYKIFYFYDMHDFISRYNNLIFK